MRYFLSHFIAFVLAFTLLGAGATHAQVQKDVSEVTGIERLESAEMRSLDSRNYPGSHGAFRVEHVKDPNEGNSWILTFYGFTEDTTVVSRSNEFLVQADGQPVDPVRIESKTRKMNDSLLEIKRVAFTRSTFEQIATAQRVTFSIGPAEFDAAHINRKDMRLILDRVPEEQGPQTASNDSSNSQ